MFKALTSRFRSLGNQRGQSLSVPVFDGALKPNDVLEEAEVLVEKEGLEDLAVDCDGRIFAACGSEVFEVSMTGDLSLIIRLEKSITALCVLPGRRLVVGLGDRVVIAPGSTEEVVLTDAKGKAFTAITALSSCPDGILLICDASDKHSYPDWAWDLMSKNHEGRLLQYDTRSHEINVLAPGLAYAFGALQHSDNSILVSESWDHQVSRVGDRGKTQGVIEHLSGYPCRLSNAADGGFWLSVFATRTQLIEFVLQEDDYRREMMQTIDPKHWVSPAFSSGRDYLEPLQGGAVKTMGILKPWAPPRSYGLVIRYNANMIAQYAFHSRVGGCHHGISATAEIGDTLFVLSKGAGRILKLSSHSGEAN